MFKAGDLACVVKPSLCCNDGRRLGFIFKVVEVQDSGELYCPLCATERNYKGVLFVGLRSQSGRLVAVPAERCIKIDPPIFGEYRKVPVRIPEVTAQIPMHFNCRCVVRPITGGHHE